MTESKSLFRVAALACVFYAAGFASIAYEHVRYPGFTEAMEGDVLQHVERAAAGKPIYTDATAEFIPLAYFPGYYYFAAPFSWLFGDHLGGPRLASCAASFVAAFAFGGMVYQQSRSPAAGLFTVALFFAGYRIKDEGLTTALPDAALLMWLALGWVMLAGRRTWTRDLTAVLFFLAAFWTKQQGALLAGWGLVYLMFVDRRRGPSGQGGWRVAGTALALFGATTGLFLAGLHPFGEGMFYFTVGLPSGWERSWFHSIQRFVLVTFLFVPFAWLATLCYAFREGFSLRAVRTPLTFAAATAAVTCLYTMSATGSSNNHYIPLFSFLETTAVLGDWRIAREGPPRWLRPMVIVAAFAGCGVAIAADFRNEEGHPLPLFVAFVLVGVAFLGWFLERGLGRPRAWAPLLLAGQFAASFYLPGEYWPPAGWRDALTDLQGEFRRLEYDVAWPDYGAIPAAFAGGRLHRFPSWVVLEDVVRSRVPDPRDFQPFRDRMTRRPPAWLITAGSLEAIPGWRDHAHGYTMELDYGHRFGSLTQLDRHWYGSRIFPRFLYRRGGNQ